MVLWPGARRYKKALAKHSSYSISMACCRSLWAVRSSAVQEVSYVKGSQLARESGVFSNDLLGNRGDLGEDAGELECDRPILLRRIEKA